MELNAKQKELLTRDMLLFASQQQEQGYAFALDEIPATISMLDIRDQVNQIEHSLTQGNIDTAASSEILQYDGDFLVPVLGRKYVAECNFLYGAMDSLIGYKGLKVIVALVNRERVFCRVFPTNDSFDLDLEKFHKVFIPEETWS